MSSLIVGADVVAANTYWAKNAFDLDYGTVFLVGTLLSGLGSALAEPAPVCAGIDWRRLGGR